MAGRKPRPDGRQLTDEELELWAAVTRDTRVLDPATRRRTAIDENAARSESAATPAAPADGRREAPPVKAVPAARTPQPPIQGGGTDRRTQTRLRRGEIEIDGRIDLHGMTQAEARRALEAFVSSGAAMNRRCVLVITGKGVSRPDDEPGFMPDRQRGVLRDQVPRWLALAPLAQHVITWQPAARKHGGDGALYLLLRRPR
jgi:DNA-nicking Smr family endonuclease